MKYLLYAFTPLLLLQLNAGSDLQWVDDQVKAIKPARSGINSSYIDQLKNPIKLIEAKEIVNKDGTISLSNGMPKAIHQVRLQPLRLETIINNNVYINGRWYTLNDKIRGKKITLINRNYIVLKDKKKKIRLFVNNKNDKIKITTR
jgi:hypothetical protein